MFIADSPAGEIYGFPIYGIPGLKIANHAGGEVVDVDRVDRLTRPGENAIVSTSRPGSFPECRHRS